MPRKKQDTEKSEDTGLTWTLGDKMFRHLRKHPAVVNMLGRNRTACQHRWVDNFLHEPPNIRRSWEQVCIDCGRIRTNPYYMKGRTMEFVIEEPSKDARTLKPKLHLWLEKGRDNTVWLRGQVEGGRDQTILRIHQDNGKLEIENRQLADSDLIALAMGVPKLKKMKSDDPRLFVQVKDQELSIAKLAVPHWSVFYADKEQQWGEPTAWTNFAASSITEAALIAGHNTPKGSVVTTIRRYHEDDLKKREGREFIIPVSPKLTRLEFHDGF